MVTHDSAMLIHGHAWSRMVFRGVSMANHGRAWQCHGHAMVTFGRVVDDHGRAMVMPW